MECDISRYSTNKKYNFLKHMIEAARNHFGNESDEAFAFKSENLHMNILGVRGFVDGKPCKSTNTVFDDVLFVVYLEDGVKKVEEFQASTEYGTVGTAYLTLGQHRYTIGYHKKHEYPLGLTLTENGGWEQHRHYRAMRPYGDGVEILRDSNRNFSQDQDESLSNNGSINIHYGGENTPVSFSTGCTTIKGWSRYKAFIKLMEQDLTIIGTSKNELAAKNVVNDGSRPVIWVSREFSGMTSSLTGRS